MITDSDPTTNTINSSCITHLLQEQEHSHSSTDITSPTSTQAPAASPSSTSPTTTISASRPRRNIRPPTHTQDFIPTPTSITSGVAAIAQMQMQAQMEHDQQQQGNDDEIDEEADEWGIPGMDGDDDECVRAPPPYVQQQQQLQQPIQQQQQPIQQQQQPIQHEQVEVVAPPVKRPRGRQKGFKVNKNKNSHSAKPTTTTTTNMTTTSTTRKPRRSSGAAAMSTPSSSSINNNIDTTIDLDQLATLTWGPEQPSRRPDMPIARIKTIMKEDKDVCTKIVSTDASLSVACATEMFLEMVVKMAYRVTEEEGRRTVHYKDLVKALGTQDRLEFLKDVVPSTIPLRKALAMRESLHENQRGGRHDA
ncbi:Chromatin accessibility complex protein 1 [Blyttiomyces sp. JEL0837]|nr:Chromatin accessibility complex protein 1 [Blyttiomyces sp. JEL0837]